MRTMFIIAAGVFLVASAHAQDATRAPLEPYAPIPAIQERNRAAAIERQILNRQAYEHGA